MTDIRVKRMIIAICAILGGVALAIGAGAKMCYEAVACRARRGLPNSGGDDDFFVIYRPPEAQPAMIVFEYA